MTTDLATASPLTIGMLSTCPPTQGERIAGSPRVTTHVRRGSPSSTRRRGDGRPRGKGDRRSTGGYRISRSLCTINSDTVTPGLRVGRRCPGWSGSFDGADEARSTES